MDFAPIIRTELCANYFITTTDEHYLEFVLEGQLLAPSSPSNHAIAYLKDSMVQVNPFVRRAGSNSVLYVYIDQAVRAMRRARITRTAVLDRPISR
jgi:hypothetical protein